MRTLLIITAAAVLLAPASPVRAGDASLAEPVFPNTRTRTETLWIFDADFEDLLGDNAGWTTDDASGSPEYVNYWHKDTIRINGFPYLGDSTWWCGTYNDCWRQPRGYGNNWICILERDFPGLSAAADPGDVLTLEYDQRYAIESCYDYGYTEISTDGGETWILLWALDNHCGGIGMPGPSQDWDSIMPDGPGHMVLDVSDYAGEDIRLRFRFVSDSYYSSQDSFDNPPNSTCLDGAWQLDNITWLVNGGLYWTDDCESPGDNGWVHDTIPAAGQIGALFERRMESLGGHSGWMMSAYDSGTGTIADGQGSRLFSPPIDVSDATDVVAQWIGWADVPASSDDQAGVFLYGDDLECLWTPGWESMWPLWDLDPGDPEWVRGEYGWTQPAGVGTHLGFCLWVADGAVIGGPHGKGFVLDRMRVGIPLATSVPDDDVLAGELHHVRPNPFQSTTSIAFSLASEGHVVIRIHDASGRVVRTLVDSGISSGTRDVRWDGRSDAGERVASGVYFVRMTVEDESTGAGVREQKLVLMR